MSLYACFDWFKKLRLFSNVRNLKIDVVLKASRAVVIRCFSLNETPLGLFKGALSAKIVNFCYQKNYMFWKLVNSFKMMK